MVSQKKLLISWCSQSDNHLGEKSYQNMEMKKIKIFLRFEIQTEIYNKNQGDLGEKIRI